MPRRGENIYRRNDGRWEGRIPDGYAEDGTKKYRSVYARTYGEVKEKMQQEKLKPAKKQGAEKNLMMGDVIRRWLDDNRVQWKDSTYSCYMQIADKHLFPAFETIPVAKMNAGVLNRFVQEKKEGDPPLSDSYVRDLTRMIMQALKHLQNQYGYEMETKLSAYKMQSRKHKQLPSRKTIAVLERYLRAHLDDDTCLGVLLCCYTGLRIGELCALQWSDIDLEEGVVHVTKTLQRIKVYENGGSHSQVIFSSPKSIQSVRDIPLSTEMADTMRRYAKGPECYIISGRNVAFAEPRTLQYRFQSILRDCGLEYFNFHMLRHIFATRCVALGFDTNSVSELLGHANVQITLNAYVHTSTERKRELMSLFYL